MTQIKTMTVKCVECGKVVHRGKVISKNTRAQLIKDHYKKYHPFKYVDKFTNTPTDVQSYLCPNCSAEMVRRGSGHHCNFCGHIEGMK